MTHKASGWSTSSLILIQLMMVVGLDGQNYSGIYKIKVSIKGISTTEETLEMYYQSWTVDNLLSNNVTDCFRPKLFDNGILDYKI